jgi:hypothetical protein
MTHTIDTFSEASVPVNLESHTPNAGGPWTRSSGTAGHLAVTTSGQLNLVGSASDGLWSVPTGAADCYAQITVSGSYAYTSLHVIRATDVNNFIGMDAQTATTLKLYKKVAGAFTQLTNVTGIVFATNDILKVTASGNALSMFQNATQRGTIATDSFNNTATLCGLSPHTDGPLVWCTKFESDANVVATGRPVKLAGEYGGFAGVGGGFAG